MTCSRPELRFITKALQVWHLPCFISVGKVYVAMWKICVILGLVASGFTVSAQNATPGSIAPPIQRLPPGTPVNRAVVPKLDTRGKAIYWWRHGFGIGILSADVIAAGINQANGTPPEWRHDCLLPIRLARCRRRNGRRAPRAVRTNPRYAFDPPRTTAIACRTVRIKPRVPGRATASGGSRRRAATRRRRRRSRCHCEARRA